MIENLKEDWRIFAGSTSGSRFRDRYRLIQGRRRGRFSLARLLHVVVGVALICVSALFGWLPVLGWGTVVLGLGMIAGEFHPAARLMDWLEVEVRRIFGPLGRRFMKIPAWAQVSISLTLALSAFALVYGIYSLTFNG